MSHRLPGLFAALSLALVAAGCAADAPPPADGDSSDDGARPVEPRHERYVLDGKPATGALDIVWANDPVLEEDEMFLFDFELRILVDPALGPNAYATIRGDKVNFPNDFAKFSSGADCALQFELVDGGIDVTQEGRCGDFAPLGGSFAGHYVPGVTPRIENYVGSDEPGAKLEVRWNDELEQIDFSLDVFTADGREGSIQALAVQVSGANIAPHRGSDDCQLTFAFSEQAADIDQLGACSGFAGAGAAFAGHYVIKTGK